MGLARWIPYRLGSRLLGLFLGHPLLQAVILRRARRSFRAICGQLGVRAWRPEFLLHLMSRLTIPWRVAKLSLADDATFWRWVGVENGELLAERLAEGKGILLVNCHTAIARLTPLVVWRLGHELAVIEPEPYLRIMGARDADRIRSITLRGQGEKFWMKELYQAQKILLGQGIVHLALDGHQGTGGVKREFLGQDRLFHVSLAQLAMQIGADIVLVRALLDRQGRISVGFSGPLDTGSPDMPVETRLQRFLDHYVAYLEKLWHDHPGNISPRHLQHHFTSGVPQAGAAS
ncbi:MAG TPA: hypothetical protein PLL19_00760 [Thiobacillaceae bacterium]|nr:hypothetical protein [Thiobacillaceae bacterium]HNA81224.1 hypothetical protein [Thiobacillaceae bacterium]HNF87828.1 hypothetical protein [Thiobacillaceae bacterium]HNI06505.1 hypothetical protein [Thiobacillaceae bacterium]